MKKGKEKPAKIIDVRHFWISQVPAITLPTCHGLTTPQVHHNLTLAIALLRLRLRYSSGQLRVAFSEQYQHFRDTASLVTYRFLCLRFTIFVQMIACFKRWKVFDNPHSPPIAQDSIRVVGKTLPDRDFHPASNDKLSCRSNAAIKGER